MNDKVFGIAFFLLLMALIIIIVSLLHVAAYPNVYAPKIVRDRVVTEMICVPYDDGLDMAFRKRMTDTLVTKNVATGKAITLTVVYTDVMRVGDVRCWYRTPDRQPVEFSDTFTWQK